jgi:hypothetical protein
LSPIRCLCPLPCWFSAQCLTRNLLALGCSLSAKSCSLATVVPGYRTSSVAQVSANLDGLVPRTLIHLPSLGLSYVSSRIIPKLCTPQDYFLLGNSRCPRNLSVLRCNPKRFRSLSRQIECLQFSFEIQHSAPICCWLLCLPCSSCETHRLMLLSASIIPDSTYSGHITSVKRCSGGIRHTVGDIRHADQTLVICSSCQLPGRTWSKIDWFSYCIEWDRLDYQETDIENVFSNCLATNTWLLRASVVGDPFETEKWDLWNIKLQNWA